MVVNRRAYHTGLLESRADPWDGFGMIFRATRTAVWISLAALSACDASGPAPSAVADATLVSAPKPSWDYVQTTDPMTGKSAKTACIQASEPIDLGSPYSPQYPQLCIRRDPRLGYDAAIQLMEGGQFLCYSSGCEILVKADQGEPQVFQGSPPGSGNSSMLFIDNTARFARTMGAAKSLMIEAEFYNRGRSIMVFPVEGYDPARIAAAG